MSIIGSLRVAMRRMDGWINQYTGVGGSKRTAHTVNRTARLAEEVIEELYACDGLAARAIDAVPKDALRGGLIVKTGDPEVDTAVRGILDALGVEEALAGAWTWGRAFGGGAVVLGADDGLDPSEPLDFGRVQRLAWVYDVDKRDLTPQSWETNPASPRFGRPNVYMLTRNGQGGAHSTVMVHASRLVIFRGARTTRRRALEDHGWGDSVLQRVYEDLRQARGGYAAVATLLQDASQGVFAIKDLYALMAQDDGAKTFEQRMELMDMSRGVARAILIDAEAERFERVETGALTGLPDILDRFVQMVSAGTEIPVTRLMGTSPAGLNATGESDVRGWYDVVAAEQRRTLKPRAEYIVRAILRSKAGPTGGVEPEGWSVDFPPLWQPTPSELADLRQKTSATDAAYITAGVLTPEEVALNRFRSEGWSPETSVDLDARRAAIEADASLPAAGDAPGADHADGIAAVIARVAAREIPRDAGVAVIAESFGLSPEAADRAMGEAGKTFFTAPEATHAAEMDAMRAEVAKAQASLRGHQAYTARVVKAAKEGGLELGAFTSQAPTAVAEGDDLQPGDVVAVTPEAP